VIAEASMSFAVPNGLDVGTAALTEPMAVALHAVRRSEIGRRETAIVIGCGPVGLAIICHLKAMGVDKIVASDFSPGRRALAARCGAQVVVDPSNGSPYDHLGKGVITGAQDLYELAVGSMEKIRKLPGWNHLYRVADKLGAAGPKRPVIFECVGVPGMIENIAANAPLASRVVVAGSAWNPTGFGPHWPASRRSTCGSCSVTRHWNSGTHCTCWPTARSTPRRW
jgi:threonine dehydrogenase-like Zn-dependent dehydrogenase